MILLATIISLAGCKKNQSTQDSNDSDTVSTAIDETPAQEAVYYLSAEGIAPEGGEYVVKVGTPLSGMPESVEGLYNSVAKESYPEYDTYTFSITETEGAPMPTFQIYDFGEHNIDLIQLCGPMVKVRTPKGDVHIGQSFLDVLNIPDVKATWEGYDYEESGTWYWTWEGLFFQPSHSRLPDALMQKLFTDAEAPAAEDFTPEIPTESISTGLPF